MEFDDASSISGITKIDIPPAWENSAEIIVNNRYRRILVIGSVDSGKSVYCRFLSLRLMQTGHKTSIVDGDVGQKDIGPPACITLGYPDPTMDLANITPALFYFVGSVSPMRHLLPMVVGTRLMVDSSHSFYTIINTTGLIHGIGRVLKSFKIEALRPDVIVGIQRGHELSSILNAYRNFRTIRLSPSPRAQRRTLEQRKSMRERAFRRYLSKAEPATLDTGRVIFQRSLLFSGRPFEDPDHIYCEKTSENVLAVSSRHEVWNDELKILPPGFEENLLCGVSDVRGAGLGLAVIRKIDFRMRSVSLLSPVNAERIRIVHLGDVYIDPQGRELSRKRPRGF